MSGFDFWRRWLVVVTWALVVFGLGLALFSRNRLFDLVFNDRVDPVFWPMGAMTLETKAFQRWIYGVLGAVLAGWSVSMAVLVQHAFPLRQRWVWSTLVLGIGVWFVVDSTVSLYFGVMFNLFVNALLLVALGAPLAATRKDFSGEASTRGSSIGARPGSATRP
jgi:hypothetical protein